LNQDGEVNAQDATLPLRIVIGLSTPTAGQESAGDLNRDGQTNIRDVTPLLRIAIGRRSV
jgi:hypothetical protein